MKRINRPLWAKQVLKAMVDTEETQDLLAKEMGISRAYLSSILSAQKTPQEHINYICKKYNIER